MNKITRLVLVLLSVYGFGLFCAANRVVAQEKKITFWHQTLFSAETEKLFDRLGQEYSRRTGFKIERQSIPAGDLDRKLAVALATGETPDVANLRKARVVQYASYGKLLPIDDLFSDLDRVNGYYPIGHQAVTYQGKKYGIPWACGGPVLYYRKDLLKKVGLKPPNTFQEMLEAAKKINNPIELFYGFGIALGPSEDGVDFFQNVLWSFGGSVTKEDGRTIALDSPQTVKALEYIKELYESGAVPRGVVGWTDVSNNEAWVRGQIGMTENGGSIYWKLMREKHPLFEATGVALCPGGPVERAFPANVEGYSVFKSCKNPDVAKGWIRFLLEENNYKEMLKAGAGEFSPAGKGGVDLPMWATPDMEAFAKRAMYGHLPGYPGPVTAEALEVIGRGILEDMFGRVLVNNWPYERAIKEAVGRVKEIYSQK